MGAHAKFAPSSAARWLECPASAILSASVSEESGDEAVEGQRVHTIVENAIRLNAPIPAEEPEDVTFAVELVLDYVEKLGGRQTVQAETRVKMSDDVWGTTDILQLHPYVTTIGDYKNGALDVEAYLNKQLLTYSAAVMEEHGPSKFYRLAVFQPNSRTAGYQPEVKQWIATLEEVEAHREKVLEAVQRGLGGEGPRPGSHCRYCKAFGRCSATQEILPFLTHAITMAPSEVHPNAALRLLQVLRGLGDFKKNLEKDLVKRIAVGMTVPGMRVEPSATHRKWVDERLAVQRLVTAYGWSGVDPVSPATAEKMGDQGKDIVRQLAFKPPGGGVLKY